MWFWLALVSMAAFGIQDLLFKVAREKKADPEITVLSMFATGAILAIILFLLNQEPFTNFWVILAFAIIQVTFFFFANLLKLSSLKYMHAVTAFPVFGLHGAITAVFAVAFLNEYLNPIQTLGVALAGIAILMLVKSEKHKRFHKGLTFALTAAFAMALSNFAVKVATDYITPFLFIAVSYLYAIGPSYLMEKASKEKGNKKKAMKIGAAMGTVNIIGFYALLTALGTGPASIIFPIVALSLLISVSASEVLYKEKLTVIRVLAILLALLSLILLGG